MNEEEGKLEALRRLTREIADLESTRAILDWDQSTYMPEGGAEARGRQIALLGRLIHERWIGEPMKGLLSDLAPLDDRDDVDGDFVRRTRALHERKARVPTDLVDRIDSHCARSFVAWTRAKPAADFATMQPLLERTVALSRELAECFPAGDHIGDPLVDHNDPGMTVSSTRALFAELRTGLLPLVDRLCAAEPPEAGFLRQRFDRDAQLRFGRRILEAMGYDFARGRQDETHHPFMTRFSAGDVRITTRIREDDFTESLFSSIHEAGHALYELGIDPRFDAGPLGEGVSAGVHESQSRLWENIVGRSRPFWACFLPELQRAFPGQLDEVTLDEFYRAVNRVRRSLIRTESDEVTYNVHVMLRFELEMQMLEGTLKVAELPEAWNARMEADLGVVPAHDGEGCLQDVHWYCTTVGGTFQGYALGNLMSAQLFRAAVLSHPSLPQDIGNGNLLPLRRWLEEQVHRHGARFDPMELIERVTGAPLSPEPFITYLEEKYGGLYPEAVGSAAQNR